MIRETLFEVPFWIKWFMIRTLKSRSESNDSWNALLSPVLNQMIHDTHFEVPFWIKWFAIRTFKSRSESNDSWNALWSPVLNQMICETHFQSLRNKSDEVQAHVQYQHEFNKACILALTETWIGEADSWHWMVSVLLFAWIVLQRPLASREGAGWACTLMSTSAKQR